MTYKTSFIIAVLDSHEVVRRQLLHLGRLLPADWELVLVDDGSDPELKVTWEGVAGFKLIATHNKQPWSQPAARNRAVRETASERLMLFDMDHVLTKEAMDYCNENDPKLCAFKRHHCDLDSDGNLSRRVKITYPSKNNFYVHRSYWIEYDESFCGLHGGDDVDWFERQEIMCTIAKVGVGVLPGASYDFHKLSRKVQNKYESSKKYSRRMDG